MIAKIRFRIIHEIPEEHEIWNNVAHLKPVQRLVIGKINISLLLRLSQNCVIDTKRKFFRLIEVKVDFMASLGRWRLFGKHLILPIKYFYSRHQCSARCVR